MSQLLAVERAAGIATLTLQRPEKRNALSIELREELAAGLESLRDEEDLTCLVLTGAGSAFCAGMDVTQFGGDRANRERLVHSSRRAFGALRDFPVTTIAAVNGAALGGGFVLALLCDIRIAANEATFGFPELTRGIPPSYASARWALPEAVARDLSLTGRVVSAAEARSLGIASTVGPDALDTAMDRATEGGRRSPRGCGRIEAKGPR